FLGPNGTAEISEGFHTIMLVKKGYLATPSYQRVFIKSREVTEVVFNLTPDKQLSYLRISNNLSAGTIYLNEKYTGMQATGDLLPVPPGLYEVNVLKNGYLSEPESQLIELTEGDERLIVFRLQKSENDYPVEIKSANPGAMINIDGDYLPYVTPVRDLNLSGGKHYLTLLRIKNGPEVFETSITVGPKNKNTYAFSF
ncbi:MAG: PEGA domain-containing protein, partial [Calditrichia bacterium]